MNRREFLPLARIIAHSARLLLLGVLPIGLNAAQANEESSLGRVPGGIRMHASLDDGEPRVEIGLGEKRLSRTWMSDLYSRHPMDRSKGRHSLADQFTEDRTGGKAWDATRATPSIMARGNVNLACGSFAAWVRVPLPPAGGLLFEVRGAGPEGPHLRSVWRLGVKNSRTGSPNELFLEIGGCRAHAPFECSEQWQHLGAVWDEQRGISLFLNGRHVASSPSVHSYHFAGSVGRFIIHQFGKGGAVDEIYFFDESLRLEEIASFAKGQRAGLPPSPFTPDAQHRRSMLGWDLECGPAIPIQVGKPVTVETAWITRARAHRKAAGHLGADGRLDTAWPSDYHGYQFIHPKTLHLDFAGPTSITHVTALGDAQAEIRLGGTPEAPEQGEMLGSFPDRPTLSRLKLDAPAIANSITTVRRSNTGELAEIQFDSVKPGSPAGETMTFHLSGTPAKQPLAQDQKLGELLSRYRPADRGYITAQPDVVEGHSTCTLPAYQGVHLITPPAGADWPIGAVRLRLFLAGLKSGTRMKVVLHDGFQPWVDWGRYDFEITGAAGGFQLVDVSLGGRPNLIGQGQQLWMTLYFDTTVSLVYRPGEAESTLAVVKTDVETASESYLERHLAGYRDCFEAMSEPRPWSYVDDDLNKMWWQLAACPLYEQMDRTGRELRGRWPDEPRVHAWYQFIHPRIAGYGDQIEVPDHGQHPRWAFLAQQCYQLCYDWARWWGTERLATNGELGNFYGDDSDLLQDWPAIGLISDPDGLLARTVRMTADGVWTDYRMSDDRPLHINGINTRYKDGLHAYEEGINVQPPAFLMDYGNPLLVERLMATARHYDGFFYDKPQDGMRAARGSYWGWSKRGRKRLVIDNDPHSRYSYLFAHPGLALVWYNGHPVALDILRENSNWRLWTWDMWPAKKNPNPRTIDLGYGGRFQFLGIYLNTRDDEYLTPLMPDLKDGVITDPLLATVLPETQIIRETSLAANRQGIEGRFVYLDTTHLGFGETKYSRSYLDWFLTGNKDYLVEGLEPLYQRLKLTMPSLTVAEQSGDRVSVPKRLISLMYLALVRHLGNRVRWRATTYVMRKGRVYPYSSPALQGIRRAQQMSDPRVRGPMHVC